MLNRTFWDFHHRVSFFFLLFFYYGLNCVVFLGEERETRSDCYGKYNHKGINIMRMEYESITCGNWFFLSLIIRITFIQSILTLSVRFFVFNVALVLVARHHAVISVVTLFTLYQTNSAMYMVYYKCIFIPVDCHNLDNVHNKADFNESWIGSKQATSD